MLIVGCFAAPIGSYGQTTEPTDSVPALDTISVPKKSSGIKSKINYNAKDSIWFDVAKQQATLFGKAHLDYEDIKVDAPIIFVNLKNSTLEAIATYDSTGKVTEWPFLQQKDDEFQAKTIIFNYKTNRGYIEDVYMQEGEGYLHTNQAYLDSDKTLFVQDGSYTTCNLATPHYHFKMNKAKVIPDDKIIASRINLYIDSIPTPIGVPFGLFPTKDKVSSGILMPQDFGTNGLGFYLRNFGFFWAINDTINTKFMGEVYSKGSYGFSNATDYKIRYRFTGRLNATYRKILSNTDEFLRSSQNTFEINWSHNPESRTGRKMTADVNFQNVQFNKFSYSNNQLLSTPSINSSVTWSLPMRGIPFSANVSLKHSQIKNSNSGVGTNVFNLPNFTINYKGERNPFKKLPYLSNKPSKIRKQFLEQFSISYSSSGNSLLTTDKISAINPSTLTWKNITNPADTTNLNLIREDFGDLLKRNKFSMVHNASIQNNIKIKAITLTPSFRYSENWYFNQSNYAFDFTDSSYSYQSNRGLHRIGRYNAGVNLSAPFYNFYSIGRVKSIKNENDSTRNIKIDGQIKFRHQITPNIGFNTAPSYTNDPAVYDIFTNGTNTFAFNKYQLYANRPNTSGKSRSLSFSLSNVFEMKIPEKKSKQKDPNFTPKAITPIKLLQLNASSSYNLAADSIKLSDINVSASNTSLLKGLMGFTATASFDPYQYKTINSREVRVDQYWAADNKSLVRLRLLQFNSNLALSPDIINRLLNKNSNDTIKNSYFQTPGYLDFSIPWSLQLGYNFSWNVPTPKSDTSKNNSLSVSGTLKLSENWSSSFSTNYNISKKEFTYPSLSLNRDLHCWIMRLSWIPFGPAYARSYSFFIGVKADILKDLKYRKQNSAYDRINF